MPIFFRRSVGVALMVGAVLASACSSTRRDEDAHERTVATSQAIALANFNGSSLPAKTVALTFDDGPGSRTLELSAFLKAQGIQATFFSNGHCFDADHPCGNTKTAAAIFAQVLADGHLVGNHTQDHLDLTADFAAGADGDAAIVAQVTETDAIIAPYVASNHFLFRAPFGFWNQRDYNVIHASSMDKYVGPINWNTGGAMTGDDATGYAADWDCWQNQDGFGLKTSTQCGNRYLNELHDVGRGIVLMHDGDKGTTINNHDIDNGGGNTVDMVKLVLVPALKAQGYTFVRADAIPAIVTALGAPVCDASCSSCSGSAANQCTGCRAGSYLSGGTCKTCSSCAAGKYQVSACTASADAVCATCSTCAAGTFTSTACSASADAVCATCSTCAAGTFTSTGCSATADAICTACDATCTTCSGPSAADCSACPLGDYRAAGACHPCTTCAAGSATSTACSSSADTACTACAPGTFAADADGMTCTACAAGMYASASGATSCMSCGGCDDADSCTTDQCDGALGCTHTAIAGCSHASDAGAADAGATDASAPVSDAGAPPAETNASTDTTHDDDATPPAAAGDGGCNTSTAPRPAGGSAVLAFAMSAWLLRRRRRTLRA